MRTGAKPQLFDAGADHDPGFIEGRVWQTLPKAAASR